MIDKEYKKLLNRNFRLTHPTYFLEYQRNKKLKLIDEIKENLKQLNVAEENSMTYKAALILMLIFKTGIYKEFAIANRTKIPILDIKKIFKNWAKNGIFNENKIILEEYNDNAEFLIQIVLISLIGSGKILKQQ